MYCLNEGVSWEIILTVFSWITQKYFILSYTLLYDLQYNLASQEDSMLLYISQIIYKGMILYIFI